MKITTITTRFWPYPAGLEVSLSKLCHELIASGHDITVLTTNSSGESSIPQIRLANPPMRKGTGSYPVGWQILRNNLRILRKRAYLRIGPFHIAGDLNFPPETEVFHMHSLTDPFLYLPLLLGKQTKPYVLTIHDVVPTVASSIEAIFWLPYGKIVLRQLLKKFSAVIIISPSHTEFLRKIGADRIRVFMVPLCFDKSIIEKVNGEDINSVRCAHGIGTHDFLIVSIGRLIPIKRYDMLMKAISVVLKRSIRDQIKCLIIGSDEGCLRDLEKTKETLALQKNVRFLGALNHVKTLQILKAADLFVMPSLAESFGLSTVEAMALSVPVLVSDGVAVSYLITPNSNGLIFKKNDINSLVSSLSFSTRERERLRDIGYAGRQTAYAFCSPEAVAKKHITIYRSVLNQQE